MRVDLSVYLVTDQASALQAGHDIPGVLHAAGDAVTAVQLREKEATARDFFETVLRSSAALPPDVAIIVNDRVDVFLAARAAGARVSGVHVGQSDLPPGAVRRLIGPEAILGLSASTPAELAAAGEERVADYVGIGALHATGTKTDAPPPLGHAHFARLVALSTLPAVAIGGVTAADLPALRRAGAAGAAVASGVCGAADPGRAARELRAAWDAS
ncbi:MAG: thiamine phosphate synthase [Leifsonia sp.]